MLFARFEWHQRPRRTIARATFMFFLASASKQRMMSRPLRGTSSQSPSVASLLRQLNTPVVRVHAQDVREKDRHVSLPAHHPANRHGDVAHRQRGGGDLVQERLEEMVIRSVQKDDIDGLAPERTDGVQAAEPASQHDDPRAGALAIARR